MPRQNGFRHQSYPTQPSVPPVVLQLDGDAVQSLDFGHLHTQFGVQKVLLVHGTFAGDDPFGIHAMMRAGAESLPATAKLAANPVIDRLSEQTKRLTDTITADVANYSDGYRKRFQTLVGNDPEVERLEPTWSSENNHIAPFASISSIRTTARNVSLTTETGTTISPITGFTIKVYSI